MRSFIWCVVVAMAAATAACADVVPGESPGSSEGTNGALADCSATTRSDAEDELVAQGYEATGDRVTFRVPNGRWGSTRYWRETTAYRYERGEQVAYASCRGVHRTPLPVTGEWVSVQGKWYEWSCEYPCGRNWQWMNPRSGNLWIRSEDFSLNTLFGEEVLTATVYGRRRSHVIHEEIRLERDGTTWSNDHYGVSLVIEGREILDATAHTVERDERGNLVRSNHDRAKFEMDGVSRPTKEVVVTDLPGATGIQVSTDVLEFEPGESGRVRLVNESTFTLSAEAATTTGATLAPGETVTMRFGVPAILFLEGDGWAEASVDLVEGEAPADDEGDEEDPEPEEPEEEEGPEEVGEDWPGVSFRGTVGWNQEIRWQSPILPPGDYEITASSSASEAFYLSVTRNRAPTWRDEHIRYGHEKNARVSLYAKGTIHALVMTPRYSTIPVDFVARRVND